MIEHLSTYRISDLVPFSREAFTSLVESYNQDIWPFQIVALLLAAALIPLVRRSDAASARLVSGMLAITWLWVGLVFHWKYFSTINWPAKYFAGLFVFEAILFLLLGVIGGNVRFEAKGRWTQLLGLGLFLTSAFLYLPLALLLGQRSSEVLLFGCGPSPTALGTIGILLLAQRGMARVLLWLPAALWCLVALITCYGMS